MRAEPINDENFTHIAVNFEDLPYGDNGAWAVEKGNIRIQIVRLQRGQSLKVTGANHLVVVLKGALSAGDFSLGQEQMVLCHGDTNLAASDDSIVLVVSAPSVQSLNDSRHVPTAPIGTRNLPYELKPKSTEKKYYTLRIGNQNFKWILFTKGHQIKKHIHTDPSIVKVQFTGEIKYDDGQNTTAGQVLTFAPNLEHYEGEILQESILLTIENVGTESGVYARVG
jgi:hypothetical protein